MRKISCCVLILFTTLFIFSCEKKGSKDNASNDEFQKFADEFTSTWNKHDYESLTTLWTEDGNLVTPWNPQEYNGRTEIKKHFAQEHADNMQNSQMTLSVQNVRMIDPETAFVDANLTLEGMTVGGVKASPFHDYSVFLLVKQDGQWKILIARPY